MCGSMARQMTRHLEWLPAALFLGFGLVFLVASWMIPAPWGGGHGNRTVPVFASLLVVILSAAQVFFALRDGVAENADRLVPQELIGRVLPLIVLIAFYALLQIWFGYLLATIISALIAFRLFGNSWQAALMHTALGTVLLYLLFVRGLGLFFSPGRLFDLTSFIPL